MRAPVLAFLSVLALGYALPASARDDGARPRPVFSEVQQDDQGGLSSPDARPPGTTDSPAPVAPKVNGKPAAPSALAPAVPDRSTRIDALFAALKAAPTPDSAKEIAQRLEIALLPSDSDTADILMSRAAIASQAKDYGLAIQLLDGVLAVAPDHLEAWNRRAMVFYMKQDYADSLADLRQVVAREPRHFGAWAGIAMICKDLGDDKHALEAARMALAVYPQLEAMKEMVKDLAITVEGRPI